MSRFPVTCPSTVIPDKRSVSCVPIRNPADQRAPQRAPNFFIDYSERLRRKICLGSGSAIGFASLVRNDDGDGIRGFDFFSHPTQTHFLRINFKRNTLKSLGNFAHEMNAFKKMKRFILTLKTVRAFNLSA